MIKAAKYIDDNYLLTSDLSRTLYHEYAGHLPIIDFHDHLDPSMIAKDLHPDNLSGLWVMSDQYKHRAMRINGIPEEGITGQATDYEKYLNWAKTLPMTLGNPVYQWSYLELKRTFDVDGLLNEHTARDIWEKCNNKIALGHLSTMSLLNQFNVEALCTSDDLLDDVSIHQTASRNDVKVLPSLRTDTIIDQSKAFHSWRDKMAKLTDVTITDLESYEEALQLRFKIFEEAGCVLADQALDAGFVFRVTDKSKANKIFNRLLDGDKLTEEDSISLKSYFLVMIGRECARRDWAFQLHIGAQRNTSSRLKNNPNAWGGYAAIGQSTHIASLISLLDTMDKQDQLPRMILYNLNPVDNAVFASLTGSFAEDSVVGKIQFGPSWWYNDHYDGIFNQLSALANHSLLHRSIGMTTDSRSFLSMSRHEYFRRVLCQFVSDRVNKGLFPYVIDILKDLIEAVCYKNARDWILNRKK